MQEAIEDMWLSHCTPPRVVISDQEAALDSDSSRSWADRSSTDIKLKPPGNIGASTVERHHELLRAHLHKCKGQSQDEGLAGITDIHILREATLAKNVRLNIHGVSVHLWHCMADSPTC